MSYGDLKKRTAQVHEPEFQAGCHAHGCPCRGTLSVEGGKWVCAAHAFIPADRWQDATRKLREHDWLIAFTDDVQRMDQTHQDWRAYATQFWVNQDEFCIPDAKENAGPYGFRMRGELLFRCGLGKRPSPRIPKEIKRRGNAAAYMEQRRAA